ncbi:MAG: hypothetical protein NT115_12910, partial [Proteobacteria bacterium]|nr:hypothetical protein [Pseudomonadota bacterium]
TAPAPPPVIPVVTPVIAPPVVPVVTPVPVADTVTIRAVVWVGVGGRRGLTVVAKTSQPSGPAPSLFATAFNGPNTVLPQTAMTLTTANITVDTGVVTCSVADPCWQLPLTRTAGNTKPSSVVVQSSKGGSATAFAGNGPLF